MVIIIKSSTILNSLSFVYNPLTHSPQWWFCTIAPYSIFTLSPILCYFTTFFSHLASFSSVFWRRCSLVQSSLFYLNLEATISLSCSIFLIFNFWFSVDFSFCKLAQISINIKHKSFSSLYIVSLYLFTPCLATQHWTQPPLNNVLNSLFPNLIIILT